MAEKVEANELLEQKTVWNGLDIHWAMRSHACTHTCSCNIYIYTYARIYVLSMVLIHSMEYIDIIYIYSFFLDLYEYRYQ